jgi:hypothetical protein
MFGRAMLPHVRQRGSFEIKRQCSSSTFGINGCADHVSQLSILGTAYAPDGYYQECCVRISRSQYALMFSVEEGLESNRIRFYANSEFSATYFDAPLSTIPIAIKTNDQTSISLLEDKLLCHNSSLPLKNGFATRGAICILFAETNHKASFLKGNTSQIRKYYMPGLLKIYQYINKYYWRV